MGVAIVGGGVAGLSAAWRLVQADYPGRIVIFELADQIGGTSSRGGGPSGAHPLGAHYLTLPSPECTHMRVLLDDLGLIEGWTGGGPLSGGRPRYPTEALCLAPQERLYVGGRWVEGLWPEPVASPEDAAQYAAFEVQVARWTARMGADERPAFAIPVAHSSRDPEIRALADLSFASWLDQQGLDSPVLRWWLRYAVRDDYGTELETTSAWAGLHYFCSRRPDPADAVDLGTHVLTWPAGNGHVVDLLWARLEGRVEVVTGALVRQLDAEAGRLAVMVGDDLQEHVADAVIAAVPAKVLDRILERPAGPRPDLAPWWVASLHLDDQPVGDGVSHAWDSVIYEGRGLGVVSSAHQRGQYGGPTVLSWYWPWSEQEPGTARRRMLETSWEELVDAALDDLSMGFPGLRRHLLRLDVHAWGHGTARPVPGLHSSGILAACAAPVGKVFPAHADLSGLSLFEEASFHGVRAAEAVLTELIGPVAKSLL